MFSISVKDAAHATTRYLTDERARLFEVADVDEQRARTIVEGLVQTVNDLANNGVG